MMSLKKNQREKKSENESNNEIKDILKSRKGLEIVKIQIIVKKVSDKSSRKNSYDCGSESDGEDKKDARDRGD